MNVSGHLKWTCDIPVVAAHSIENKTDAICRLVEVQIGGYLGEDDIVRLQDIYGREYIGF